MAVNNDLGFDWDNNSGNANGFDSGLNVPVGLWSMVALVITPSNSTIYLGNTVSGLISAAESIANGNEPWGGGVVIGSDPGSTPTGRAFGGAISSVVMFSNSLSVAQLEALFDIGEAQGDIPPAISVNSLFTNYDLLTNGSVTITPGGYGGPNGGGFWQKNTGSGWTTLARSGHVAGIVASPVGTLDMVSLTLTNVDGTDAGSYQLVLTNSTYLTSGVGATSSVVTVSLIPNPPANTFEAVATSPGYGCVAYWPLDDVAAVFDSFNNVSANLPAYDVWGGWNGIYGTNALDGASSFVSGLPGAWARGCSAS